MIYSLFVGLLIPLLLHVYLNFAAPKRITFPDWKGAKMVLCFREDLKMGKGKIGAQCSHAALKIVQTEVYPVSRKLWKSSGSLIEVVGVKNGADLKEIYNQVQKLHDGIVPLARIRDAGRTQIPAGTETVVGFFMPLDGENVSSFAFLSKIVNF